VPRRSALPAGAGVVGAPEVRARAPRGGEYRGRSVERRGRGSRQSEVDMRTTWMRRVASAALCATASAAWALDVGDKAPPLEIKEWVQGEPVVLDQLVGKKVVVVEFWATWCPPCKESIPHLSKLAERYKANLEIIGVSDEAPGVVKEFAADGKFKYRVACDSDRNTNGVYMEGVNGIPHAFVIDLQGNVAWAGHPMMGLDAVVEKVLAGKYDVAKAKDAAVARKELMGTLQGRQDADMIGAACDKVLSADPSDTQALDIKLRVLKSRKNDKSEPDVAGYKAFVAQHLPKVDGDWRALNAVAWALATDDGFRWRDAAVALKTARRAVEVSQSKESAPLGTLARTYFETGLLDQALETQRKAVALDDKDDGLKSTLAYYEACADLRKQVGGPAPAKKK
jgi:peroxiredoxin